MIHSWTRSWTSPTFPSKSGGPQLPLPDLGGGVFNNIGIYKSVPCGCYTTMRRLPEWVGPSQPYGDGGGGVGGHFPPLSPVIRLQPKASALITTDIFPRGVSRTCDASSSSAVWTRHPPVITPSRRSQFRFRESLHCSGQSPELTCFFHPRSDGRGREEEIVAG